MQSIRYGVGLLVTAALTTAVVIETGFINKKDKRLVVHQNIVKRPLPPPKKPLNPHMRNLTIFARRVKLTAFSLIQQKLC